MAAGMTAPRRKSSAISRTLSSRRPPVWEIPLGARGARESGGSSLIIDSHAHIFPFLGSAPGADHLRFLQRGISGNQQPARRAHDNAIVPHPIWDPDDYSPGGFRDVKFRVGRFGRFEWTMDEVDYYKQFMPPSLVDNACDADYLVAEMDYAGVDVAVLQNDHFYGSLDELFADAVAHWPHRFVGTLHIDEMTIGQSSAINRLEEASGTLGLRGIFYDSRSYWSGSRAYAVDDSSFREFWRTVERLDLVVYWVPGAPIGGGLEGYVAQLARWLRLRDRFPDLKMVIPGGLPSRLLTNASGQLPTEVTTLSASGNVCYEICYPIAIGGTQEYPYYAALDEIRRLYESCGPAALAWGSDVPNVLRYCTYAQSLNYIRRHADFIPAGEMEMVLGGNLARLFALPTRTESALCSTAAS